MSALLQNNALKYVTETKCRSTTQFHIFHQTSKVPFIVVIVVVSWRVFVLSEVYKWWSCPFTITSAGYLWFHRQLVFLCYLRYAPWAYSTFTCLFEHICNPWLLISVPCRSVRVLNIVTGLCDHHFNFANSFCSCSHVVDDPYPQLTYNM